MATSNEIENVWKEGKAREAGLAPLTEKELQAIISSRVRKELKTVGQFVWATIAYQIILYSFLTHALIRHWGEMRIMVLCLAAAAFYIPLTVALIRRVGTLCRRPWKRPALWSLTSSTKWKVSTPGLPISSSSRSAWTGLVFRSAARSLSWSCSHSSSREALKGILGQALPSSPSGLGCPSLPSRLRIRNGSFLRSCIWSRSSMISKITEWPKWAGVRRE